MDFSKTEAAVVESAELEAEQIAVKQLNELHLSLVGGGVGEVIFG